MTVLIQTSFPGIFVGVATELVSRDLSETDEDEGTTKEVKTKHFSRPIEVHIIENEGGGANGGNTVNGGGYPGFGGGSSYGYYPLPPPYPYPYPPYNSPDNGIQVNVTQSQTVLQPNTQNVTVTG